MGLRGADSRGAARRCAPKRHQALGAGAVCRFTKFAGALLHPPFCARVWAFCQFVADRTVCIVQSNLLQSSFSVAPISALSALESLEMVTFEEVRRTLVNLKKCTRCWRCTHICCHLHQECLECCGLAPRCGSLLSVPCTCCHMAVSTAPRCCSLEEAARFWFILVHRSESLSLNEIQPPEHFLHAPISRDCPVTIQCHKSESSYHSDSCKV